MLRARIWTAALALTALAYSAPAAAKRKQPVAPATSDAVAAPAEQNAPTEPASEGTEATVAEPTEPATAAAQPVAQPEPAPAAPATAPTAAGATETSTANTVTTTPASPKFNDNALTKGATVEEKELQHPNRSVYSTEIGGRTLQINPFIAIVGGGYFQHIENTGTATQPDYREDRFTTVAMSRLGVRAHYGEVFSLVSELELNAGPHGTSVWEGQAALQVRNQLMRLQWKGLRFDVGRITDPTSLDFFSGYAVGNMLLTDDFARFPLLVSGFNRGNGVHASYDLLHNLDDRYGALRLGFTANAGNPTATTGTVMIGGTFPPFARFYQVPWSDVGRDARGFPTDSFHVYLLSPSLRFDQKLVSAQVSGQWFAANTNTNTRNDDTLTGYNLRGGVMLKLWKGRFRPFVNGSRIINDVVDPDDTARRSDERYQAITANGGVDLALFKRFGVGAQYNFIHEQQGNYGTQFVTHFANIGLGFKILPFLDLDARYGVGYECEGFTDCSIDRQHRFYLTLKGLLGDLGGTAGRP
jgi:hypothetical protein